MSRRRPRDHRPGLRSEGAGSRRGLRRPSEADVAEAVTLLDVDDWADSDIAELREFMSCERLTERADPEFRERLRMDLWWALMVLRAGGSRRLPRA